MSAKVEVLDSEGWCPLTYLGVNKELQSIVVLGLRVVLRLRVMLVPAGHTDCRVKPNTSRYAHRVRPNFRRKQPRK